MFDLEHRALARLVRACRRLRNDAVESRAFKPLQPVDCQVAIARHRRQMKWASHAREQFLELFPALSLGRVEQTLARNGEQIEGYEFSRRRLGQLRHP